MDTITDAEIVVVGGGAVGCGVAYALARAGKTDILLLEQGEQLGQVTTCQGAGLCGQVRDTAERTKLAMHSVAVFREMQADPDVKPDWHEVGSLRIALNEKRAEEFRRLKQGADEAGLEAHLIDRHEASRLFPLMQFDGTTAILWCPSDGYMTPVQVVKAYEHQCRKRGVRFATSTTVEGIKTENGRVIGITTNRGSIKCRYVINAAGAHAYHIAQLAGLDLPIVPVRHEYFITMPMPSLPPTLPCFRIPELTLYGRVRDNGLLLGGWEPIALSTDPREYPLRGAPPAIQPDLNVLESFDESFKSLLPAAAGLKKNFIGKGWPTFTPDGRFIIGESSRVKGFVMAGGCNAHGISGSGGIGKLLVESLLEPHPGAYARSLSPDRFTERPWNWTDARREATRIYETYYGTNC
ncbi:MAG TPA: FAD-dependent oxidoreductase [Candidatus Limnocylindria bacterium]|jgi:glycine/D-amino acid oxidase-like deaminating enzyme|nr:FAD-dependent oxidoreductase [Candidatus Limnocylindria bacterium]